VAGSEAGVTGAPTGTGTGIQTAGGPVHSHVEVGEEIADHTCHAHADAIGNPDNVPTAVILGQPLRVVCRSGWQESGASVEESGQLPADRIGLGLESGLGGASEREIVAIGADGAYRVTQ